MLILCSPLLHRIAKSDLLQQPDWPCVLSPDQQWHCLFLWTIVTWPGYQAMRWSSWLSLGMCRCCLTICGTKCNTEIALHHFSLYQSCHVCWLLCMYLANMGHNMMIQHLVNFFNSTTLLTETQLTYAGGITGFLDLLKASTTSQLPSHNYWL